MVDLKVVEQVGGTEDRLRSIFTAKVNEGMEEENRELMEGLVRIRESFEERIASRIIEGATWSCDNANFYQSIDLAWDGVPIHKHTLPLLLYAQGKIKFDQCVKNLDTESEIADEFCTRDPKSGEVTDVSLPRLYETSVNLVRSFITRRVAAQTARFSNLWPYFKYEARGTQLDHKLRAEALSQRVDIMSDQFGYRHYFPQTIRDMFLYTHSLSFPSCSWVRETQWRSPRVRSEFATQSQKEEFDTVVTKEGVEFVNPHPTRVFWDHSAPLAKVNTNDGPNWLGWWDICRYRDIKDNGQYWNREEITNKGRLSSLVSRFDLFFQQFFDPCALKFKRKTEPSLLNDREENIGYYAIDEDDMSTFVTQVFMKVNPKDEGICDYPFDVWMRFVVADEDTVIYAEFLPSLPAAYGGINEHDGKLLSNSMAHDILPFQDQATNILSQMLLNMKAGLTQIWLMNKDILDDEMQKTLKASLKAENYYENPIAMFFSGSKMEDMGLKVESALKVVQLEMSQKVNESLNALTQVINLAERLLIFSPQELGQPAPREISATEVTAIANTTNSIFTMIADGIDEQRAAVKKILYESLVSQSTDEFELPITGRFSEETIQRAGFEVRTEDNSSETDESKIPSAQTIIGTPELLLHDYVFTSRDGAERPLNSQAATTLTQLLQIPAVQGLMTPDRLIPLVNEIFRLSGAGYDLNLSFDELDRQQPQQPGLPGAAPGQAGPSPELQQLMQIIGQLDSRLVQIEGLIQQPQQPVI